MKLRSGMDLNSGHCLSFFKPAEGKQTTLNPASEKNEQEAESMANHVLRTPALSVTAPFFQSQNMPVQRQDTQRDENHTKIQMKKKTASEMSVNATPIITEDLNLGGQKLDANTKASMEAGFGYDFSNVQIHNDSIAHQSSSTINALAYTYGNHIFFGQGQYQPETNSGRKLLAHELTHVMQQNHSRQPVVSRKVDDKSDCSPTIDKAAPPNPRIFITLADMLAHGHLSTAILRLKLDLITDSSGIVSGDAFDAYRSHFGDPVAVRGKFKNRFDGSLHDTLALAQVSEMLSLIDRLETVRNTLDKGIIYHCMGNFAWVAGDLAKCKPNSVMRAKGGSNAIGICPAFWQQTGDDPGITIIHELFHIKLNFRDHDDPVVQTAADRLSEPQCYAGFVAAVNNEQSTDISCPTI
jgi:hypothetical protein